MFRPLVLAREDRLDCKRSTVKLLSYLNVGSSHCGHVSSGIPSAKILTPTREALKSKLDMDHDDRLSELRRTVGEYEHLGLDCTSYPRGKVVPATCTIRHVQTMQHVHNMQTL